MKQTTAFKTSDENEFITALIERKNTPCIIVFYGELSGTKFYLLIEMDRSIFIRYIEMPEAKGIVGEKTQKQIASYIASRVKKTTVYAPNGSYSKSY